MAIMSLQLNAQSCTITTNVNGNAGTSAANNIGQTFTACGNGRLSTIEVNAVNSQGPTGYVKIYQGTTLIGTSGSIPVANTMWSNANTWDVNSLDIQLVAGQVYKFTFHGTAGALFAYGNYANPAVDYYPGGAIVGAGNSWNDMFLWATVTGLSTTLTPAHAATNVSRITPIEVEFNLPIAPGTGQVTLKNLSDLTTTVTDVQNLVINGNLVEIPGPALLDMNTQYEVIIPAGALQSTDGINFPGIASGEWTFTTSSGSVPTITTTEDTLTNVSPIPFAVTFTEAVTGLDATDFNITNGTAGSLTGSGTSYTFNVTPTASGDVVVDLPENVSAPANEPTNYIIYFDNDGPTLNTNGGTYQLGAAGIVTITANDINNATSDNYSDANDLTLSVNPTTFTCADLGAVNVTVTATDEAGNTSIGVESITIAPEAPTINIQNVTGALDAAGNYVVVPNLFDNGSVGGCGSALNFNMVDEISTQGGGIDLDGVDDFLAAPIPTSFNYGTAYTIEGWVKSPLPGSGAFYPIFFAGDAAVSDIEIYVSKSSNDMTIVHNRGNGGTVDYVQFQDPPNNVWYHLAVVYNGSTLEVFYDGVSQGVLPLTAPLETPGSGMSLGYIQSSAYNTNGAPKHFLGQLDEFRIWTSARTSQQVNTYMGKCMEYPSGDLVSAYDFEDGSGLTATDVIGGNDLTLTNMDGASDWISGVSTACLDVASVTLTCADLGSKPLILEVADSYGSKDTSVVIVLLEDNIDPVAQAQNISVQIDPNTGVANITPAMVDNGSSDNCSLSMSLSKTDFVCAESGINSVDFTVTDASGNTATTAVNVTVTSPISNETVTATETFLCSSGPLSTTVTTGSSQTGVLYSLRDTANNIVDGPIPGTGGPLAFNTGTINDTTTFNVFGEVVPIEYNNYGLSFDGGMTTYLHRSLPT